MTFFPSYIWPTYIMPSEDESWFCSIILEPRKTGFCYQDQTVCQSVWTPPMEKKRKTITFKSLFWLHACVYSDWNIWNLDFLNFKKTFLTISVSKTLVSDNSQMQSEIVGALSPSVSEFKPGKTCHKFSGQRNSHKLQRNGKK